MTQPQQVLPGGPASPVSSEATEREANIYRAVDLVAQLARAKPLGDPAEYLAGRYNASEELAKLGIGRNHFGELVTSFNRGGMSSIRGFLERHFSTWNGEQVQMES